MMRLPFYVLALVGLTACGDSSATVSPATGGSDFATLESEYGTLETTIVGESRFAPAGFGTSSTATYNGYYFLDQAGNVNRDMLGEAVVSVDFATDGMTATVTDLVMRDGTAMTGTLTGAGSFARAGSPDIFFPTVSGSLTGGGSTHDVSGNLQGEFRGASGEYLTVSGSGTVSVDGGPNQGMIGNLIATSN